MHPGIPYIFKTTTFLQHIDPISLLVSLENKHYEWKTQRSNSQNPKRIQNFKNQAPEGSSVHKFQHTEFCGDDRPDSSLLWVIATYEDKVSLLKWFYMAVHWGSYSRLWIRVQVRVDAIILCSITAHPNLHPSGKVLAYATEIRSIWLHILIKIALPWESVLTIQYLITVSK